MTTAPPPEASEPPVHPFDTAEQVPRFDTAARVPRFDTAARVPRFDTAARVPRFDVVERALHWANATLFGILLFTGAALYVGPLSTLVGRRALLKDVHVIAGLLLPVPFVLALAGRWRGGLRRDLTALNRWNEDDRRWLRTAGRDPFVRLGKFNPGQKLNAAFVAGAIVVMLATGAVLRWYGPFPDDWRTGATFVHDLTFLAVAVVVAGHIAFAVSDRPSLWSMVRGWVPASWARGHHPAWYEEVAPTMAADPLPTAPAASAPDRRE